MLRFFCSRASCRILLFMNSSVNVFVNVTFASCRILLFMNSAVNVFLNVTFFFCFRASCRILLFMNSAVNVFIYAGRLAAFRKSIKNDFTKLYKVLCFCTVQGFSMKHSNSVSSTKSVGTHTDISHSNCNFSTNL
jgi:hypothetical protein